MTQERFRAPDNPPEGCSNGPRRSSLEGIRRRADQFSEIARKAQARIEARGEAHKQLENVRNEGGQ